MAQSSGLVGGPVKFYRCTLAGQLQYNRGRSVLERRDGFDFHKGRPCPDQLARQGRRFAPLVNQVRVESVTLRDGRYRRAGLVDLFEYLSLEGSRVTATLSRYCSLTYLIHISVHLVFSGHLIYAEKWTAQDGFTGRLPISE